MEPRIAHILEAFASHVHSLSAELARLARSDQFSPTPECFQLIERLRGNCVCTLENISTIERRLQQRKAAADNKS
mgnify:CR=1 FL=1